jgi:endonuclease G
MNKHIILFLVVVLQILSCKQIDSDQTKEVKNESTSYLENGTFDFLPSSTSSTIYTNEAYSFSYIEEFEQSEWVAYELSSSDIINSDYKRPYFKQDKSVKTKSADWRNFKNSGYNKGHLCPAADRKSSYEMFELTFLTSNASPQMYSFNSGIWNRLEQKVRYWAHRYDGVYIITGGVLGDDLKTIGKEGVAVPNFFYKIILTKDRKNMIGFLMPHQESKKQLYSFVVPVDEIEKITGIDFFKDLPDDLENSLEANKGYTNWRF